MAASACCNPLTYTYLGKDTRSLDTVQRTVTTRSMTAKDGARPNTKNPVSGGANAELWRGVCAHGGAIAI